MMQHNNRLIFLFTFSLLLGSFSLTAQIIQGKIVDAHSLEPLPFVNISLEGTTQGTTTDINGRYTLPYPPTSTVRISYVGYTTLHLSPEEFQNTYRQVALQESAIQLAAVTIVAGENPAHKIIRKVIANRQLNDPENLPSFQYKAYHKFYATLEGTNPADTSALVTFLNNSHFFISETVSERKYVKPNLNKETITGNRMSGVKDPFFAVLASDFQPFTFYKDYITLLEKDFRNPISPGSIGKYDYQLADTLYRGTDTTYILKFEPLPGKVFEGLKGQLYINTNNYALEYVLARPADDKSLMDIEIQQQYVLLHGQWFPRQLNTVFLLKEYKIKNRSVQYIHSSHITEVETGADISRKEFGLLNIEFAPDANRKGEAFWQHERLDTLEKKEQNTYKLYDSLGSKLSFLNTTMGLMEGISTGKLKWGKFYLPLEHLLRVNKYEGLRLGFGLQTGETISRVFQWEGHFAYGFKDRALKYGGGMQINFRKQKDLYLRVSYLQDVQEPGNAAFIKPPPVTLGNQSYRNYLTSRMDSVKQFKASLHTRPFRFTQVALFAQQQKNNPAYNYTFTHNEEPHHFFTTFETGLQIRFAFRENYTQVNNATVVTSIAYPQINLHVSRSLRGPLDGEYDFFKAELAMDHQFTIRGFGQSTWKLTSGFLQGDVPYPFLFNGRGSNYDHSFVNSLMVSNYFQTMGLYEFVSDRYAYLFFSHNFGRLTGTHSKYFRPELSLIHNMGIGNLKQPSLHQQITFSTMGKGFFESGLVINNLFRFKYVNILYWGIGAGIFYRYGSYQFAETDKNISAKLSMTFSF